MVFFTEDELYFIEKLCDAQFEKNAVFVCELAKQKLNITNSEEENIVDELIQELSESLRVLKKLRVKLEKMRGVNNEKK